MKKLLIISLITLSVLMITGCGSSSKKSNQNVENCKDCVFAFYKDYKHHGENGDVLTEYTKDYTTLKDKNGNQRKIFLGHKLDENGKISIGYVCGIQKGKAFCLEGTSGEEVYESNRNILKKLFGEENCSSLVDVCKGDVYPYVYSDGDIRIEKSGNCYVKSTTGTMYCSE